MNFEAKYFYLPCGLYYSMRKAYANRGLHHDILFSISDETNCVIFVAVVNSVRVCLLGEESTNIRGGGLRI